MLTDNKYEALIPRGRSEINDSIFDFLKPKIKGKWLDVGSNIDPLLLEVPEGTGVDASLTVVAEAQKLGLNVTHGWAEELPYGDNLFDTVVLSCVLEQCVDPIKTLNEALRVCKGSVIGVSPIGELTEWGIVGGNKCVKSVIDPKDLKTTYGAKVAPCNPTHYYFEIKKPI